MTSDQHDDEFQSSRNNAKDYPVCLVRKEAFGYALEKQRERLKDTSLFHAKWRSLAFIDLYPESQAFYPSKNLDTLSKLSGYLDEEDGAPYWRLVFLQSQSSRGALGCSREQLTLLLSYYQVMPSFLDFVFTFKPRTRPVAHAVFRHESYLDKDSPTFSLNSPKRSGVQIQHAFNLLSVERADSSTELSQWPMRQVAMYHSFDVVNGRCVWIFLKGNSIMGSRIFNATKSHRHLKASAIKSPESSFAASLQVHVIVMEWCVESWAEYIDQLDEDINNKSVGSKIVPVDQMTSSAEMAYSFARKSTMHSTMYSAQPSRRNTAESATQSTPTPPSSPPGSPGRAFTRSFSDLFPAIRRVSGLMNNRSAVNVQSNEKSTVNDPVPESGNVPSADRQADEDEKDDEDDGDDDRESLADLEKNVSFQEFQRMNLIQEELERALFAIEQNRGVIRELQQHYRNVMASHGVQANMRTDLIEGEISSFFRKIEAIDRDLGIYHSRLKSLSRTVENDKTLFNAILSYKSEKSSEFFALSAKVSSEKMEGYSQSMEDWTQKMHKIAVRTEQETVSMHIITIFTLIFLPGTFLAVSKLLRGKHQHTEATTLASSTKTDLTAAQQTFFSSGVLRWDEDGTLGSDWVVRVSGMKLFMYICVPMMLLILVGWFGLYLHARRKGQQRIRDAGAEAVLVTDGKRSLLVNTVNMV